jgi:hypothetical protein
VGRDLPNDLGVVPEDSEDLALVQEVHLLGREIRVAEC